MISSYTSVVPNGGLGEKAYDGNTSTYEKYEYSDTRILKVSNDAKNTYFDVKLYIGSYDRTTTAYFEFYDADNNLLNTYSKAFTGTYSSYISKSSLLTLRIQVPENATQLKLSAKVSSSSPSSYPGYVLICDFKAVN